MYLKTGVFLMAVITLAVGCGMSRDRDERLQGFYSELRGREDAHHVASLRLADPAAVRDDTHQYSDDMHALMDQMMEVCADMMGSGMMGNGGYDGYRGMTDRMKAAVAEHRTTIDSLEDVEAMRAKCEEHHASMDTMFDQMGDMMSDGMMGGGMM